MDDTSHKNSLSTSHKAAIIATLSLLNLGLIYLVYNQNLVFGSSAGKWVYRYFEEIQPIPIWVSAASLILLWLLVFAGGKFIRKHERITLAGVFLIVLLLQLIITSVHPIPLSVLVKSDLANTFYSVSLTYSPAELLSQYQEVVPTMFAHARTNMPGKTLFFHFLGLFTSNPRIMAYLIIAFSTLGGVLLYGICKLLFDDRRTALYAFILYVLVPAKLAFFPILNTVTPVVILACLLLLLLFIQNHKIFWLMLLGVGLYLLILFEPAPLPAGLIFIGVIIYAVANRRLQIKHIGQIALITVLSFALTYLLFLQLFSFDLFSAFDYVLDDVVAFNTRRERDYWIWLGENLKEFFFATGIPVSMVFIYTFAYAVSRRLSSMKELFLTRPEFNYLYSLAATFAFVWLMNINRGETTRLWIYLSVFFQVPAAYVMGKQLKNSWLFFIVIIMLALQSLVTLQCVQFMNP